MRLIDADALMKEFRDFVRDSNNSDFAPVPNWNDAVSLVGSAPTVDAVEVVRCRDCKHFEYNHWEKVNRVPLILAHEICTRWGEGCKTSEDGYCFLAERKEVEDG